MPATRYAAPFEGDAARNDFAGKDHPPGVLNGASEAQQPLYTWGSPPPPIVKAFKPTHHSHASSLSWTDPEVVLPGAVSSNRRKSLPIEQDLRRVPPHLRPDVPPVLKARPPSKKLTDIDEHPKEPQEVAIKRQESFRAVRTRSCHSQASTSRVSERELKELERSLEEQHPNAATADEGDSAEERQDLSAGEAGRQPGDINKASARDLAAATGGESSHRRARDWRRNRDSVEKWMSRYYRLVGLIGVVGMSAACLQHEAVLRGMDPSEPYIDVLKGVNSLCSLVMLIGLYRLYALEELFKRIHQVIPTACTLHLKPYTLPPLRPAELFKRIHQCRV